MTQRKKWTAYRINKDFVRNNKKRELAKLAAFLLTDGGLSRDKRTYVIYFTNKSEVLHEVFESLIRDLVPQANMRSSMYKGVKRTYFNSLELAELLFELSDSYRTAPCESYPVCAKIRDKPEMIPCIKCNQIRGYPNATYPEISDLELLEEILQIIADTEGGPVLFIHRYPKYISIRRRIEIGCSHPILKKQIKQMLEKLAIPSKIAKDTIRIEGKGIRIFRDKIGFRKNVKMSTGNFEGYNKNSVLEIMIITNELITKKKFFPSKVDNLNAMLMKAVELFDNTFSRERVVEFLVNGG